MSTISSVGYILAESARAIEQGQARPAPKSINLSQMII